MSRRTARVREIAAVIALMARETVGCDTPGNSPITACTMFWRRYIKVAAKTRTGPGSADNPRPPLRAAERAARRTHHQWPVVHSIMMAHSFRGHGGDCSTPMIPHGGGPSSYRLPEMTQDTPRINFSTRPFGASSTGCALNDYPRSLQRDNGPFSPGAAALAGRDRHHGMDVRARGPPE